MGDEDEACVLEVSTRQDGSYRLTRLDADFVSSGDYRELCRMQEQLCELPSGPYLLEGGGSKDEPLELPDLASVAEAVLAAGRKGLTIQRYKGLGEMNPEQLWDTTMNPGTRTMLRVEAGEDIRTDEIFTILMGDDVERRRRFIEDHALEVRNLDV